MIHGFTSEQLKICNFYTRTHANFMHIHCDMIPPPYIVGWIY
jgi:hypothetical protein